MKSRALRFALHALFVVLPGRGRLCGVAEGIGRARGSKRVPRIRRTRPRSSPDRFSKSRARSRDMSPPGRGTTTGCRASTRSSPALREGLAGAQAARPRAAVAIGDRRRHRGSRGLRTDGSAGARIRPRRPAAARVGPGVLGRHREDGRGGRRDRTRARWLKAPPRRKRSRRGAASSCSPPVASRRSRS